VGMLTEGAGSPENPESPWLESPADLRGGAAGVVGSVELVLFTRFIDGIKVASASSSKFLMG
jgi:hypothetical protein